MLINKIKASFIVFLCVIGTMIAIKIFSNEFRFTGGQFFGIIFYGSMMTVPLLMFGLHKPFLQYFDNKYYAKQDEINFQTNLRRELERKRALSQIDNENLHYQNQLRIEYIAQVAQIHLQSNQYLANMYQQAIINNSTQNELTAQKQLLELEAELTKQGLI